MTEPEETVKKVVEIVKSIFNYLGATFRHVFPGILALCAIKVACPSLLESVGIKGVNIVDITVVELIVLGLLALVIGNVLFVVHRYSIQQLLDFLFWFSDKNCRNNKKGYAKWLAEHVWKFFSSKAPDGIREHIRFRYSSVVLMYLTAEVILVASPFVRNNLILTQGNFLVIVSTGFIILIAAGWQNYLLWRIEGMVAEKCTENI